MVSQDDDTPLSGSHMLPSVHKNSPAASIHLQARSLTRCLRSKRPRPPTSTGHEPSLTSNLQTLSISFHGRRSQAECYTVKASKASGTGSDKLSAEIMTVQEDDVI